LEEFKGFTNIEFIDAIDGRNENEFNNNYKVNYSSDYNFTKSTIAVICSHIKSIYTAYHNNLEKVCIFEDDVHTDLIKCANFTLLDICNLNNNWEIIQLFYVNRLEKHTNDFFKNGLRLIRRNGQYLGTCYIINKKGMEKILSHVVTTNGTNYFNIIPKIINPEDIIFNYILSYVINRQVFYYWCDIPTFDKYIYNDEHYSKVDSQNVCFIAKNKLLNIYA